MGNFTSVCVPTWGVNKVFVQPTDGGPPRRIALVGTSYVLPASLGLRTVTRLFTARTAQMEGSGGFQPKGVAGSNSLAQAITESSGRTHGQQARLCSEPLPF